ncbi:MAG TPA: phage major capsid protein [Vicinamibacterales bacterium]|nr:phage major capsid protein [Vicinamibacterales bacterium]
MNRYEKELQAIDQAMLEHVKGFEDIYALETKEDRKLTDDERLEVEKHVKAIEVLKGEKSEAEANLKTVKDVEAIGQKLGPSIPSIQVGEDRSERHVQSMVAKSLGEQFVSSAGYKSAVNMYRESGRLPQGFSTGPVAMDMKGTLLEGAGGGGGALAATVPQVVPGVVDKLFQKLTFADLLLQGQATTNSLRYVVEGTATSGAAGVAEGGLKPQSTLGLTTTDEPIKKIATSLKVSDEMLEDAPAIQSYINGRLSLFVQIEEERQLIRGTSGGNEVQGLLTSRSVPVYAGGTAAGNRAVQLFKAMNGLRGSAFLEPDWIVLHPTDWEAIRLLTDTAGQFYGGGPFQGPYGSGSNLGASGQVGGALDSIWNKPVYVTGVIGAGTAIIGTSSSAQVWRKGGMSVEVTNANEDDFLRNLIAIRAEERLGLAVYRPTGFVEARIS